MEHRSLRLGDIVDDYCPRERRITNHAIVAMVGDTIKQTRCATCEAEHVYKEGRAPRKRAKGEDDDAGSANAMGQLVHPKAAPDPVVDAATDLVVEVTTSVETVTVSEAPAEGGNGDGASGDEPTFDGWLAHRPLIRATLPRTEGEPPPARAIPEFTMHQRQGRGGRGFQQQGWRGNGNPNGNRPGGGEPDGNRAPGQGGGRPGRHRGGRHRRRR